MSLDVESAQQNKLTYFMKESLKNITALLKKDLLLEFNTLQDLPLFAEPWKGKTVLVNRVKRKYWFDKKNVLFYSTGFRWIRL